MKNLNIMGVHQFLGEGGHKNQPYIGNCLKSGAWQKIGRRVFLRGGWYLDAHYDITLVYAKTADITRWCERIEFWSIVPAVSCKQKSKCEEIFSIWI